MILKNAENTVPYTSELFGKEKQEGQVSLWGNGLTNHADQKVIIKNAENTVPYTSELFGKEKQEGQVFLDHSPEFCLKLLIYRCQLETGHACRTPPSQPPTPVGP